MNKPIEVTLHFERETKRTCLYKTDASGSPIQNIYVAKDALGDVYPDKLKVTVEAEDA